MFGGRTKCQNTTHKMDGDVESMVRVTNLVWSPSCLRIPPFLSFLERKEGGVVKYSLYDSTSYSFLYWARQRLTYQCPL